MLIPVPPALVLLLLALAAETAFALYLAARQSAHVRAHRGAVPADFTATVDLPAHQKAADYTVARLRAGTLRQLAGLALSTAWLLAGYEWLYDRLATLAAPGLWRSVLIVLAATAAGELVVLPFRLHATFATEARFGFNRTTPARFAADLLKGWLLGLLIAVPLLFAAFALMAHARGLWWFYAWAGFMCLTLALSAAFPRFIAPLFNRFTPLEGTLRTRLDALLARCGFRADGLFVMDASRRSAKGNAYFTGLGRTKRIVLFDTLVANHTEAEIEAVLAHELGHFRHRHILLGTARLAVTSLAAFACFGLLARQPFLTASIGLHALDPALTLLVFLQWFAALGPVLGLAGHWFSRRAEFQADAYARDTVGAEPLVSALTRLTRDSAGTLTPDPLYALFEYSHPPVPVRVRHLRTA